MIILPSPRPAERRFFNYAPSKLFGAVIFSPRHKTPTLFHHETAFYKNTWLFWNQKNALIIIPPPAGEAAVLQSCGCKLIWRGVIWRGFNFFPHYHETTFFKKKFDNQKNIDIFPHTAIGWTRLRGKSKSPPPSPQVFFWLDSRFVRFFWDFPSVCKFRYIWKKKVTISWKIRSQHH